MTSFKILSVGEILWDMLPGGKKPGGAPANFAYHSRQLGAEVRLQSRVGEDELGRELLDFCNSIGLSTELISTDNIAPTGTVAVELRTDGQPIYTIVENVAWDNLAATPESIRWASEANVIAFGSLAARSSQNRQTLEILLDTASSSAHRLLDLNLRPPFCERNNIEFVLSCANILKLNDEELVRMVDLFGLPKQSVEEQLKTLQKRYRFRLVILTCGANGSWLTTESEQVFTPGIRVKVADTVGAGDAFTAASIIGFLHKKPLTEIARKANELGAYVCTQHGGTPRIPEQFHWNQ
jgi:fructokinase